MTQGADGRQAWEEAVAALLKEGAGVSGRLRILSLAAVRKAIGEENWPKLKGRVHTAVETVMGRLLTPRDRIVQAGEDTYVLVIRARDFEAAGAAVQRGCDALAKAFFGEGGGDRLAFEAEVVEIVPPGSDRQPRVIKVRGDAARAEAPVAAGAAAAPAGADADKVPAAPAVRRQRAVEQTEAKPAGRAGEAGPAFEFPPAEYLPVWDCRHEVVATYCVGVWPERGAETYHSELFASFSGMDAAQKAIAYDKAMLKASLDAMAELERMGRKGLLIPPLCAQTLRTAEGRKAYLTACYAIPKPLRKLMRLRVADIPPDTSPNLFGDWLAPFTRFFGSVILLLDGWDLAHAALARTRGVTALTFMLPANSARRKAMLERLPDHIQSALRVQKIVNVHGATSPEEVAAAKAAGALYVSGAGVAPAFKTLKPPFALPAGRLPTDEANAPGFEEGHDAA